MTITSTIRVGQNDDHVADTAPPMHLWKKVCVSEYPSTTDDPVMFVSLSPEEGFQQPLSGDGSRILCKLSSFQWRQNLS